VQLVRLAGREHEHDEDAQHECTEHPEGDFLSRGHAGVSTEIRPRRRLLAEVPLDRLGMEMLRSTRKYSPGFRRSSSQIASRRPGKWRKSSPFSNASRDFAATRRRSPCCVEQALCDVAFAVISGERKVAIRLVLKNEGQRR